MPNVSRDFVLSHQYALTDLGHDPGPADGLMGPRTRQASADYLASKGEPGPVAPTFKGRAEPLADIDLPRIGSVIGVGEDEIHALIDVESAGRGYDAQGRVVALFEPHVFWRELGPGPERDRAAAQGLAYRRWGERPYPRDSYPRILSACQIDSDAALRSTSWGLGQIMGFNAQMCGYDSAAAMVTAFADSEAAQLEAMVAYIIAAGLDDELRRHDWRGFARGYNGPGYASHGYHTKLARSFAKWQAIPDTPYP